MTTSSIPQPCCIASANGLEATRLAFARIIDGTDTLDAVVEGITLVEDDPDELTVGYGGLPNENGVVELDAAVMHGPSHRAGGVAGLQHVRHAAQVARLVMEQSDHSLLVGEGALAFARAHGFMEENLLTEKARKIWLYWKQTNSQRDDWLPPPIEKLPNEVREFFKLVDDHGPEATHAGMLGRSSDVGGTTYGRSEADRPSGTVHVSAIDADANISCSTTTSGLAFKMPGRVGDSPLIGAGLYVDNAIGSCGSTGRGEANMRACSSFAVVELMRLGAPPVEAGLELLNRIVTHTTEPHLLNESGRPNFGLKLYILNKRGEHAGVSLWGPTKYAVTDAEGTRHAECRYLWEKGV